MNTKIRKTSTLFIVIASLLLVSSIFSGQASALQSNQVKDVRSKANAQCDKNSGNTKANCKRGVELYISSKGNQKHARSGCSSPARSIPMGPGMPSVQVPAITDPACVKGVDFAHSQLTNLNKNSNSPTAAAKAGFDLGKTSNATCQKFSGSNKEKCKEVYKEQLRESVSSAYSKDKTSKDLCKDYKGSDKTNCEQVYRDIKSSIENAAQEIENKKDPALNCVDNPDDCNLMKKYINPIIGFLTAFVGIAVTIGIISGGIRMASSADDPSKMAAGKKQIGSAIAALVAMMLLYAAVRWLTLAV